MISVISVATRERELVTTEHTEGTEDAEATGEALQITGDIDSTLSILRLGDLCDLCG